ncbi:hypothetical protein AKJ40_02970, partial [candidate division MSBL1 archaeon SCGC-AAA259M10]
MKSQRRETELHTVWYGPDCEVVWGGENTVFRADFWEGKIEDGEYPEDYVYDVYWHIGPSAHYWKTGKHSVEVILNGDVVETLEFNNSFR